MPRPTKKTTLAEATAAIAAGARPEQKIRIIGPRAVAPELVREVTALIHKHGMATAISVFYAAVKDWKYASIAEIPDVVDGVRMIELQKMAAERRP